MYKILHKVDDKNDNENELCQDERDADGTDSPLPSPSISYSSHFSGNTSLFTSRNVRDFSESGGAVGPLPSRSENGNDSDVRFLKMSGLNTWLQHESGLQGWLLSWGISVLVKKITAPFEQWLAVRLNKLMAITADYQGYMGQISGIYAHLQNALYSDDFVARLTEAEKALIDIEEFNKKTSFFSPFFSDENLGSINQLKAMIFIIRLIEESRRSLLTAESIENQERVLYDNLCLIMDVMPASLAEKIPFNELKSLFETGHRLAGCWFQFTASSQNIADLMSFIKSAFKDHSPLALFPALDEWVKNLQDGYQWIIRAWQNTEMTCSKLSGCCEQLSDITSNLANLKQEIIQLSQAENSAVALATLMNINDRYGGFLRNILWPELVELKADMPVAAREAIEELHSYIATAQVLADMTDIGTLIFDPAQEVLLRRAAGKESMLGKGVSGFYTLRNHTLPEKLGISKPLFEQLLMLLGGRMQWKKFAHVLTEALVGQVFTCQRLAAGLNHYLSGIVEAETGIPPAVYDMVMGELTIHDENNVMNWEVLTAQMLANDAPSLLTLTCWQSWVAKVGNSVARLFLKLHCVYQLFSTTDESSMNSAKIIFEKVLQAVPGSEDSILISTTEWLISLKKLIKKYPTVWSSLVAGKKQSESYSEWSVRVLVQLLCAESVREHIASVLRYAEGITTKAQTDDLVAEVMKYWTEENFNQYFTELFSSSESTMSPLLARVRQLGGWFTECIKNTPLQPKFGVPLMVGILLSSLITVNHTESEEAQKETENEDEFIPSDSVMVQMEPEEEMSETRRISWAKNLAHELTWSGLDKPVSGKNLFYKEALWGTTMFAMGGMAGSYVIHNNKNSVPPPDEIKSLSQDELRKLGDEAQQNTENWRRRLTSLVLTGGIMGSAGLGVVCYKNYSGGQRRACLRKLWRITALLTGTVNGILHAEHLSLQKRLHAIKTEWQLRQADKEEMPEALAGRQKRSISINGWIQDDNIKENLIDAVLKLNVRKDHKLILSIRERGRDDFVKILEWYDLVDVKSSLQIIKLLYDNSEVFKIGVPNKNYTEVVYQGDTSDGIWYKGKQKEVVASVFPVNLNNVNVISEDEEVYKKDVIPMPGLYICKDFDFPNDLAPGEGVLINIYRNEDGAGKSSEIFYFEIPITINNRKIVACNVGELFNKFSAYGRIGSYSQDAGYLNNDISAKKSLFLKKGYNVDYCILNEMKISPLIEYKKRILFIMGFTSRYRGSYLTYFPEAKNSVERIYQKKLFSLNKSARRQEAVLLGREIKKIEPNFQVYQYYNEVLNALPYQFIISVRLFLMANLNPSLSREQRKTPLRAQIEALKMLISENREIAVKMDVTTDSSDDELYRALERLIVMMTESQKQSFSLLTVIVWNLLNEETLLSFYSEWELRLAQASLESFYVLKFLYERYYEAVKKETGEIEYPVFLRRGLYTSSTQYYQQFSDYLKDELPLKSKLFAKYHFISSKEITFIDQEKMISDSMTVVIDKKPIKNIFYNESRFFHLDEIGYMKFLKIEDKSYVITAYNNVFSIYKVDDKWMRFKYGATGSELPDEINHYAKKLDPKRIKCRVRDINADNGKMLIATGAEVAGDILTSYVRNQKKELTDMREFWEIIVDTFVPFGSTLRRCITDPTFNINDLDEGDRIDISFDVFDLLVTLAFAGIGKILTKSIKLTSSTASRWYLKLLPKTAIPKIIKSVASYGLPGFFILDSAWDIVQPSLKKMTANVGAKVRHDFSQLAARLSSRERLLNDYQRGTFTLMVENFTEIPSHVVQVGINDGIKEITKIRKIAHISRKESNKLPSYKFVENLEEINTLSPGYEILITLEDGTVNRALISLGDGKVTGRLNNLSGTVLDKWEKFSFNEHFELRNGLAWNRKNPAEKFKVWIEIDEFSQSAVTENRNYGWWNVDSQPASTLCSTEHALEIAEKLTVPGNDLDNLVPHKYIPGVYVRGGDEYMKFGDFYVRTQVLFNERIIHMPNGIINKRTVVYVDGRWRILRSGGRGGAGNKGVNKISYSNIRKISSDLRHASDTDIDSFLNKFNELILQGDNGLTQVESKYLNAEKGMGLVINHPSKYEILRVKYGQALREALKENHLPAEEEIQKMFTDVFWSDKNLNSVRLANPYQPAGKGSGRSLSYIVGDFGKTLLDEIEVAEKKAASATQFSIYRSMYFEEAVKARLWNEKHKGEIVNFIRAGNAARADLRPPVGSILEVTGHGAGRSQAMNYEGILVKLTLKKGSEEIFFSPKVLAIKDPHKVKPNKFIVSLARKKWPEKFQLNSENEGALSGYIGIKCEDKGDFSFAFGGKKIGDRIIPNAATNTLLTLFIDEVEVLGEVTKSLTSKDYIFHFLSHDMFSSLVLHKMIERIQDGVFTSAAEVDLLYVKLSELSGSLRSEAFKVDINKLKDAVKEKMIAYDPAERGDIYVSLEKIHDLPVFKVSEKK